MDAARANEFCRDEAMANELAARHLLAAQRRKAAEGYLRAARHLYERWGARRKVERALANAPWPAGLLADVASVTIDDFDLIEAGGRNSPDINDSLDLVAIAERP